MMEYRLALQSLIADLKAGHSKRCMDHKEQCIAQKARDDLQSIKDFPALQRLQMAVMEGYMRLKLLVDKYEGKPSMPALARGATNASISGGHSF